MNDHLPEKVPDGSPLDEELVAYLDGELDAESARRIEALLASDPEVRRRLHSFERTWDLLDELDAAPVGEPFTHTTLEMVATAARQDVEQDQADAPQRRRRWLWTIGLSLITAMVVGFLAVAMHDPDRQLLRDLPIIENLDEYRAAGSIEFLRKLRSEGLFSKDDAESAKNETADDEDIPARRQRIRNMSLDDKEQLLKSQEQFASPTKKEDKQRILTKEDKQRIERLYRDLQADSERDQLRATMHEYYEWLKVRSPFRFAMVTAEEPDKRIALVKESLQEEQRREGSKRPGHNDMEAIGKWVVECATRDRSTLLASWPDSTREQFAKLKKDQQQPTLFWLMLQKWQGAKPDKLPPLMTEADLAQLREKVSPKTRRRLEGVPPPKQAQLLIVWLRPLGPWHSDEGARSRGLLSKDDDERLAEFFETNLSPEQRDQLLSLPSDEMLWRLQEMYYQTRGKFPEGPNRRPEGPSRHGRPPLDSKPALPRPSTAPPGPETHK
jgi:hypothetical protein